MPHPEALKHSCGQSVSDEICHGVPYMRNVLEELDYCVCFWVATVRVQWPTSASTQDHCQFGWIEVCLDWPQINSQRVIGILLQTSIYGTFWGSTLHHLSWRVQRPHMSLLPIPTQDHFQAIPFFLLVCQPPHQRNQIGDPENPKWIAARKLWIIVMIGSWFDTRLHPVLAPTFRSQGTLQPSGFSHPSDGGPARCRIQQPWWTFSQLRWGC